MGQSYLDDLTRDWGADEHIGKKLALVSGTGAGQEEAITSNTATRLSIAPAEFDPAPDSTTRYEVRAYFASADAGAWTEPGKGWEGDLIISGGGVVAEGEHGPDIIPSGKGCRMLWLPKLRAFRAGYASRVTWNEANIGKSSFAFGEYTKASGDWSACWGNSAEASGRASLAFGEAVGATAAFAIAAGKLNIASGIYSIAIGQMNFATGGGSIAIGESVNVDGHGSIGIGKNIKVDGNDSFVFGKHSSQPPKQITASSVFVIVGQKVGIDALDPQFNLSLNQDADQSIGMYRESAAGNSEGKDLSITAGGASLGATDKSGGSLILSAGVSTGEGSGRVIIKAPPPGASGAGDNAPTEQASITGRGEIVLPATGSVILGEPETDGSWRIKRDGDDLVFERRVGGSWEERSRVDG